MTNQASTLSYCSQGCDGHKITSEVCSEFGPVLERTEDEILNYIPTEAELAEENEPLFDDFIFPF